MPSREPRRLAGWSGAVLALGALLSAGCGGGDGAGPDVIQVTFSPPLLATSVFDDFGGALSVSICPSATLAPVPDPVGAVVILESGDVFQAGATTVTEQAPGTFRACLPLRRGLAAGLHEGSLTLRLCKDPACGQVHALSGETLRYAITVHHAVPGAPPITADIAVDGAVTTGVSEGLANGVRTYQLALKSGQVIEVRPSAPFVTRAYTTSGATPPSVLSLVPTVPGGYHVKLSLPGGAASGSVVLRGRAAEGQTVDVTVSVTPP